MAKTAERRIVLRYTCGHYFGKNLDLRDPYHKSLKQASVPHINSQARGEEPTALLKHKCPSCEVQEYIDIVDRMGRDELREALMRLVVDGRSHLSTAKYTILDTVQPDRDPETDPQENLYLMGVLGEPGGKMVVSQVDLLDRACILVEVMGGYLCADLDEEAYVIKMAQRHEQEGYQWHGISMLSAPQLSETNIQAAKHNRKVMDHRISEYTSKRLTSQKMP